MLSALLTGKKVCMGMGLFAGMMLLSTPCLAGPAPVILIQPSPQTVPFQGSASFSVTASSGTTMTYQWLKDGSPILGATASSFSIASVHTSDQGTYSVKVTNGGGTVSSQGAALTVLLGVPYITSQPASQVVTQGQAAVFSVQAGGADGFNYQWSFNGTALSGATGSSLTLSETRSGNAGGYSVVVANLGGSATSQVATLTVIVPVQIATQPQSEIVAAGSNVLFRVSANGTAPLSYQWSFNGIAFPSATNSVLAMTNVQPGRDGSYRVLVTNPGGAITSSVATLTVVTPATASAIVLAPSGTAAMTPNGFTFHMSVTAGSTYVIEASSDLSNWDPIATNYAASSAAVFTDTSAANYGSRFYRARTP